MANRRKEIPSFVSIEVGVARSIAEAMTDDEWGKWSKKALDDLSIGCTRKDTDARVRNLYEKAKDNMDKEYLRKKEWYENRKAQGNQLTADGDTREDSQAKPDGSAITRNETRAHDALEPSANIYGPRQAKNGDAATREGAEAFICRESGVAAPTTVSRNMRRVPQNEAPAHGFSGGRTAQGTMSRSPEAAAQSGKAYDQVAYHSISTDEKPAGVRSLPSPSRSPVGNRHAAVDVLNLAYAGEFGNVRLTQEQYAQLGIKFGNLQKLNRAIDSLSCQIENGEKNPANHYAELVKWASYRDDMEEKEELRASTAPHYETVSEHNARVLAAGKKWIDEHFPKKDNKHG